MKQLDLMQKRISEANVYETVQDMVKAGAPGWPTEAELMAACHVFAAFCGPVYGETQFADLPKSRIPDIRHFLACALRFKGHVFGEDPAAEIMEALLEDAKNFLSKAGTA